MKILKIAVPVLLAVLVTVVIIAPIGPMPGIFIGGKQAAIPDQWPDTSDLHEINLQVPGTIPRVVTIWVIDFDGELYVSGYKSSGWVQMLGDGGPVNLRIRDNTYAVNAQAVTENRIPIMQAYMDKYRVDYPDIVESFPSVEEAADSFALYHLAR